MNKFKTPHVLKFPLPFHLLKSPERKVINGAFFTGLAVANALRNKIYSSLTVVCTNADAFNAVIANLGGHNPAKHVFQAYSNISTFKLNIRIDVVIAEKPMDYCEFNVHRVLATPSLVYAESSITDTDVRFVKMPDALTYVKHIKPLEIMAQQGYNVEPAFKQITGESNE